MRGDAERLSLAKLINAVLFKNEEIIKNPLNGKSAHDVSLDELHENYIMYCNMDFYRKNSFGMTSEEIVNLTDILRNIDLEQNSSTFPDFVFENGFIEHFRITSSKTTGKGSTHERELSEFKVRAKRKDAEFEKECGKAPEQYRVYVNTTCMQNPAHSYEYLKDAFINSWQHHIDSCNKYTGKKEIGIFIVEYSDIALSMHEDMYSEYKDGATTGDLRAAENFDEYRLSRDKEMLSYIYEHRECIKYVVFENCERIEIISTDSIPCIIKLLPWSYRILPLSVITMSRTHICYAPKLDGDTKDEQT